MGLQLRIPRTVVTPTQLLVQQDKVLARHFETAYEPASLAMLDKPVGGRSIVFRHFSLWQQHRDTQVGTWHETMQ
jgi:hypothetical protein